MNVDFNSMTQGDINDLIRQCNQELEKYSDREKTKVYAFFIPFEGWNYFLKKENCIDLIKTCIEEDNIFYDQADIEFKTKIASLNDAELEYCRDYHTYKSEIENPKSEI